MYKVLTEYKDGPLIKIQEQVNEHLDKGWKLAGGISTHVTGIYTHFTQALVKKEDK